ncbi:MAG: class I tRNA ligase family protein, partial [Reyranella sp.]|nr:class I tRNA ligase family protein [Reyranella sp.]
LEPEDLLSPRTAISCAVDIEFRETRHLFLKLSAFEGDLRRWIATHPEWPLLVRSIALKWLDEGLKDRCITRDLAWGVPVPKPGYEGKVFYVWFDAPIGYIAAAAEWSEATPGRDWRAWWEGGDEVRYVQFLAKDNVPFHTISFPATILGSGLPLKLPDTIKGLNWLTFNGGKFSTGGQHGIFTDTALALLPADTWRWWLAANAPESSDTDFTVERFVEGVNKDLADGFGNLVNRCLTFATMNFGATIPSAGETGSVEHKLTVELDGCLQRLRNHHESLSIRKATEEVRAIWKLANAYLAETAPWSVIKRDPDRAAAIARTGINLVRVAALVAWPFVPTASTDVLRSLGEDLNPTPWPHDDGRALTAIPVGRRYRVPPLLFPKITVADVTLPP